RRRPERIEVAAISLQGLALAGLITFRGEDLGRGDEVAQAVDRAHHAGLGELDEVQLDPVAAAAAVVRERRFELRLAARRRSTEHRVERTRIADRELGAELLAAPRAVAVAAVGVGR